MSQLRKILAGVNSSIPGKKDQMSKRAKIGLIILVFIATVLRLRGLFANSFHADEALFATWARLIAVWRDPLLAGQLVDKPPLLFYLQALFYPLFGPTELAARVPNIIASVLITPLTGVLTWRIFKVSSAALIAAAIVTFSPLLIQFSATAFTDPLLSALVLTSLLLAARTVTLNNPGRPVSSSQSHRWTVCSGIFFGLSMATKYQALLLLPLFVAFMYLLRWKRDLWLRWLAGVLAIFLLVVIWDMLRVGSPNIFSSQISSYGGVRLAWSWEVWTRLETWVGQWPYLMGAAPLATIFLILTIPFFVYVTYLADEFSAYDQLLAIFVLGYFVVHWIVAVPIWDRYLVLVAPYFAILTARMLWRTYRYVKNTKLLANYRQRFVYAAVLIVLALLLVIQTPDIVSSYRGELPVGGQPDADGGIADAANFLRKQPPGTVLYDHWYSWQWRYHLFDSSVFVSWFPSPQSLLEDLRVFGGEDDLRFVAVPKTPEAIPIIRELKNAGFDLVLVSEEPQSSGNIAIDLYRITSQ
jgi:4-amino-4-deoxy-L-arabinose transferase-like glycosyltransferase